jgi:hypothetical protein
MRLAEAAGRAADKVLNASFDLEEDDLFVLSEKMFTQHYRVMGFYSIMLRDLSRTQDRKPLPKELTDLLQTGAAN